MAFALDVLLLHILLDTATFKNLHLFLSLSLSLLFQQSIYTASDPKTVKEEALESSEKQKWKSAKRTEFESVNNNHV